jgi:hypothetical protein
VEAHDYTPAPWAKDTFADARTAYVAHVGRSYTEATNRGITVNDLVPDKITIPNVAPIIIFIDVTGSMEAWPTTIFSKLGYLDHEARCYFGEDWAIVFGAIGDAFCDRYPLQIQPPTSGVGLKDALTKLIVESGGGGSAQESYDLGALYAVNNIETPNAVKPLLIFIGDEGLYSHVYPDKAAIHCKVTMTDKLSTRDLFDELQQKYNVYLIRKPYGHDQSPHSPDRHIQRQWEALIGEDHVALLPEAERVVDVLFGIFAQVTGKVKEFNKELTERQLRDKNGSHKVEVVMKSLVTIHRDKDKGESMKKLNPPHVSVTRKKSSGKRSDDLLA